jgi:hypothetical protein
MPKGYLANGVPVCSRRKILSPGPTEPLTPHDIAWAAGIYEGEGCCYRNGTRKDASKECASVTQKDRWILDRLQAKFGGSIDWSKSRGPIGNGVFRWRLSGVRARGFLQTIFILLSPRRREQILKLGFMNQEA